VKTKKSIRVELAFDGTGKVVERPKGTFRGSAVLPRAANKAQFNLLREDDLESSDASLEGRFQINIWGSSEAYRALGTYLLALAELDSTADPGYHEHVQVGSFDGRTQLEVILRKPRAAQPPNKRLKLAARVD
jgi:hypothetical protein